MPHPQASFRQSLLELGAAGVQHIHADLASHLTGTADRLRQWGNDEPLCLAGPFHAVYGTFGFDEKLVELEDRPIVAEIIGKEAEAIVYLYGACNRALTYPEICRSEEPTFHDRFSNDARVPSILERRSFAELTAANEIDVAAPDPKDYLAKYGQYVLTLFHSARFRRLLSEPARRECVHYFGK